MRPAVFFDRDNTLIPSSGYLGDPAEVRLVEGAAEAVARVRAFGFAVVVASNQSGVARGLFTEEDVRAVNLRIDELLRATHPGALVDRHEFCPYHAEAPVERYRRDSELRKPRPGMLLRAASELGLDLPASWMIGDAPRDIEAGRAAGCHTILLRAPGLETSPAATESFSVQPDAVVSSLSEAVEVIERRISCGRGGGGL
jgi:histidinol-phosphate phosphatase family protein